MCDPVTLTVTGMVIATAAGGMTAYGQYQSGQAQDKYYRALADNNETEAQAALKTAEQKSTIAQNEAAQRSKELKGDVSRVVGAQKAAMAANGLFGISADDVLSDTVSKARLDEANLRYNADIQSWAAKKEGAETATALRNQGSLYRFAGKQAKTAAMINMTSTILGTASSIFMGAGGLAGLGDKGGKIINTGKQSVGGHSFTTAWSPNKLY